MNSIVVTPLQKDTVRILDIEKPIPKENQLLIKVLQVGICGTDKEINEGLYGEAPPGKDYLVLGHEMIGEVVKGDGYNKGDLVVATVRRPCDCLNCSNEESDMCLPGEFSERGIGKVHGFMSEYIVEDSDCVVKVSNKLRDIGVLLEPMSICVKAVNQIFKIQDRLHWKPKTALILGAGPIGLLSTFILRLKGIETWTVARRPLESIKAKTVQECGGKYVNAYDEEILGLKNVIGNIDIIIEATGNSHVAFEAMSILGTNGVMCLTSITGGKKNIIIDANSLNLDIVLGNKVVFGTVNANRYHFQEGLELFEKIQKKWPGLLEKLITRKVNYMNFMDGFNYRPDDIRNVIEFD